MTDRSEKERLLASEPGRQAYRHFYCKCTRAWKGDDYTVYRVMRIVERTIDRKGQLMLDLKSNWKAGGVT